MPSQPFFTPAVGRPSAEERRKKWENLFLKVSSAMTRISICAAENYYELQKICDEKQREEAFRKVENFVTPTLKNLADDIQQIEKKLASVFSELKMENPDAAMSEVRKRARVFVK